MSDPHRHPEATPPTPGRDAEMDALLREWHRQNAARAAAGREALLARLRDAATSQAGQSLPPLIDEEMEESLRAARAPAPSKGPRVILRRIAMHRTWSAAAAAVILAALLPLLMISRPGGLPVAMNTPPAQSGPSVTRTSFEGYIMCPEGGRLDARDPDGDLLGPCELRHTDVVVDVSGFLTRVTLTQKYHNPHPDKIEAVYTFPLSERSAVDRMTMTIGNRVIEGQVKERAEARRIYEEARAQGRIASLLEQERPNIFTQSIANIEPGASIDITISYVETTKQTDGVFEFDFPTTIGPRFIPGNTISSEIRAAMPPSIQPRRGLVLLAPATISELHPGDPARGTLNEADLSRMLRMALPVRATTPTGNIWYSFRAAYQDGSAEFGTLYTDGLGTLNGRWFWIPEHAMSPAPRPDATGAGEPGAPFAPNTDRVPDAAKITPMPQTPGTRAGHDISITVNIDTGGPALGLVKSDLHDVVTNKAGSRATVKLASNTDIPNRDFVLKWAQESRDVEPALFTYSGPQGNFFAVQMTPPPVSPAGNDDDLRAVAVPREMIFVLDVSGSMKGRPIEKAKEVLDKSLSTLRAADTFNIIKFQNSLDTLWAAPRPVTPENLAEARAFYNQQIGGGGTQMLQAIQAAYADAGRWTRVTPPAPHPGLQPLQLANLPADGRRVILDVSLRDFDQPPQPDAVWAVVAGIDMPSEPHPELATPPAANSLFRLAGRWETSNGRRCFLIDSITPIDAAPDSPAHPSTFIVFLTDGLIGNDNEVLAEIQANRARAAVFPFAIGNSPNRYLLDSMARVGRGEVEYVYDSTNADESVARFANRIQTPVLTNIGVEFSPNLNVLDVMTALGGGGGSVSTIDAIPDLFDVKPLTIVGRYNQAAHGTVTITGNTASGPYRRIINVDFPPPAVAEPRAPEARPASHRADTIATLWARAKVEAVTFQDLRGVLAGNINPTLRAEIVSIGESFGLVTQYTSFVAVDRLRMTIAGQPRLVHIPIELPAGTDFNGFFGEPPTPGATDDDDIALLNFGRSQWVDADGDGVFDSRWYEGAGRVLNVDPSAASAPTAPSTSGDLAGQQIALSPAVAARKVPDVAGVPAAPVTASRPASPAAAQSDTSTGEGVVRASRGRSHPGREPSAPGRAKAPAESEAPPPPPAPAAAPSTTPAPTQLPAIDTLTAREAADGKQVERSRYQEGVALLGYKDSKSDAAAFAGDRDERPFLGLLSESIDGVPDNAAPHHWSFTEVDQSDNTQVARVLELYFASATPLTSHDPRTADPAPASQRVVLAEHVIVRVARLMHEAHTEDAAALATALADALPDLPAAIEARRVFTSADVSPDERTRVIDEQAQAANDRLEAMRREAKLRRRLTPELLTLLPSGVDPVTPGPGLLITLLVEDTDEPTRAALTKAGLRIESFDAPTKVIVGTTPPSTLADIALTEHVRRVELTK